MRFVYLIAILAALASCKSTPKEIDEKDSSAPTLFPITEIIEGDIYTAEHEPVTPLEIISSMEKKDSLWLKREDIRNWATPFLQPLLDSATLYDHFIEKSFLDKTIDAFTIIYERKESSAAQTPWQLCNLYIDPENNHVEKIYLVKDSFADGKSITTQLTWTLKDKAIIRTLIPDNNGNYSIDEKIMIWGNDKSNHQ